MRFRGFFRSAFRQRQRRSFSTTANKLPVSGLLIGSAAFLAAPFFFAPIQRELWTKISVDDSDTAYPWLTQWLQELPYTQTCLHLNTLSKTKNEMAKVLNTITNTESVQTQIQDVQLIPHDGTHFFFYNGKFVWITYTKERNEGGVYRSLSINVLGRDREFIEELLKTAQTKFIASKHGTTTIFTPGQLTLIIRPYSC